MPPARSPYRPRKTPRQQRAWETRGRILEAAARVFARHGYASGTTDRIAEEAGLSIGSLYQYFPNKDAILVVLTRNHVAEMARLVAEVLAEPRPLTAWLPELTRALVRIHGADPRLHQVMYEQAPRTPEVLAGFREAESEAVAAVERLLRADPAVATGSAWQARFVVATIESLVHRFTGDLPAMDPAELEREIVTIVTRYLCPGPDLEKRPSAW
ncbi:TetR/AcrR family transcriptional regulator [Nonomuraea sp. NPDC046802]|uniref:TetR/AcrR family transcriptional regulator n=1 Tax=Nonomuraea sp. NPDC046802 TaxID=3154919 RepID=UPI003411D5C8